MKKYHSVLIGVPLSGQSSGQSCNQGKNPAGGLLSEDQLLGAVRAANSLSVGETQREAGVGSDLSFVVTLKSAGCLCSSLRQRVQLCNSFLSDKKYFG